MAKIDVVPLIIVRFSIRNHRWKARNLSFLLNLSDLTLLERPAPLLGRIRYFLEFSGLPYNLPQPQNCRPLIIWGMVQNRKKNCSVPAQEKSYVSCLISKNPLYAPPRWLMVNPLLGSEICTMHGPQVINGRPLRDRFRISHGRGVPMLL